MLERDDSRSGPDCSNPYFEFARVACLGRNDPALDDLYRLRYEVYCIECGFIDALHYPEQKESDAYNDCSAHLRPMRVTEGLPGR